MSVVTDIDKCKEFGLDPDRVRRIANRLSRAAKEAREEGLIVFGGSGSGSLRYVGPNGSGSAGCQNIVADLDGPFDGGDGGDVF